MSPQKYIIIALLLLQIVIHIYRIRESYATLSLGTPKP